MGVLLIALGLFTSMYPLAVSGISGGNIVYASIQAPNTANVNEAVTVTANLYDSETKQVIPGIGVEFTSSGGALSSRGGATDDVGSISVTWTAPATPGTYTVTAKVTWESFSQHSTYSSSSIDYTKVDYAWASATKSIAVATAYVPPPTKTPTTLLITMSSPLPPNTATQATVILQSSDGSAVSGDVHVRASWRTQLGTGIILVVTGGDGKAVVNFSTPTDPGAYSLSADYLGSDKYSTSSNSASFTVASSAPSAPPPAMVPDGTVSVPTVMDSETATPTLNMWSIGFTGLGLVTLFLANRRMVKV